MSLCLPVSRSNAAPAAAAHPFLQQDYDRVVDQLLSERSQRGALLVRQARHALSIGRHAEASSALADALDLVPHLADFIHFTYGQVLMAAGHYDDAASAFLRASRTPPFHWQDEALSGRAAALRLAEQPAAAANVLEKLIADLPQNHPKLAALQLELARALIPINPQRAADLLVEITINWPSAPSAPLALDDLEELKRRGITHRPLTFDQRMTRVRNLRRMKRFDQTLEELKKLSQEFPFLTHRLKLETFRTLKKAQRKRDVLTLAEALYDEERTAAQRRPVWRRKGRPVSWLATKRYADALAWNSRLSEAVSLLLRGLKEPKPATRERWLRAAGLLSRHGSFREALQIIERVARITRWPSLAFRGRLAWLTYRAGDYDRAVKLWRALSQRKARRYYTYWQARAQQRAGRVDAAAALYRQLLERHTHSYYGYLARSRLSELQRHTIAEGSCPPATAEASVDPAFDALLRDHGGYLPGAQRARTLWQAGQVEHARRELRLAAIDLGRGLFGPRRFRVRTPVERVWRLTKPPTQWAKPGNLSRQLRSLDVSHKRQLLRKVGPVLQDAQVSYYGWRFSEANPDPLQRAYPRAYQQLVLRTAKDFGLDPNLIWAIMRTESAYRSDAISRVQAGGLMQLMPQTAVRLAEELGQTDFDLSRVFDPQTNLKLAGHYLRALIDKFSGQLPLVAAAYNGGPHNVSRWLDFRGAVSDLDEFVEEIPLRESRRYAKKIVRLVALYERAYCGKDDMVLAMRLDPHYRPYPDY